MKIDDDLYNEGDSIGSLLHNCEHVLHKFECNNLNICNKIFHLSNNHYYYQITTTILGMDQACRKYVSFSSQTESFSYITANKHSTVKRLR